ncbi:MAG TPA: nuclear transport factor 2 family protein [Ktedonobacteraceae bacterium]|nr:nuclear transport factor 2 family protein [Ktedonobacteraceae bacterium]
MEATPGRTFYNEQLAYLFAKDIENLINRHYNEDAVLIGFDFVVRGRDALKEYFRAYLEKLGSLEVKSTNKFHETTDTIFLEASVVSHLGPAVVYDAMVLRNGKISYHFTGIK